MPTPISTVNDRAAIHLSANTMVMWPELAKYPMLVITEWSYIDHYLGTLLADMMHAGIPEALAIYQSIWSPDGRRKALTNVAETALDADGFSLFRAVVHGLTPSRDDRHRFAHHLWGYSPDLPDALLLAPSRLGSFKIHYREEPTKTGIITKTDRQQVMVWTTADLEQASKAAEEAHKNVGRLKKALDPTHVLAARSREQLLANPVIDAAYAKFKK